ncbi:STM3941 family protein [Rhizobium sp. PL01]|uniref:STM3941 family protein n=1 Tax=Rhizobium sp. PL01 TaxID=3085631 RepID=UPI0029821064|nr:STM3941 family protein [Rhizobium sp. PL01]MDW5313512.1 STM3941 family protein [Rhizobium sp. PL01]
MTPTAIVVHRSRRKMALLLLGAVAFVALGAFMMKVSYDEQGAGAFGVFIGLVSILFFGLCAVVGLIRIFDRRPAIEFSGEGLLARDVSAEPIAWQDILAARMVTYRRQPIIELMLSPSAEQSLPFTRTVRFTRAANSGLGFHGVCLSGAGLDIPATQIVEMIGEWAERAQPEALAHP